MAKKYYWLKLNEGFFRDKRIKKLRRIAGGDTYTIIYLKMQLMSLKTEGKLYFEGIESNFVEELALDIDEEVENVKITVAYLMNSGLLQEVEADSYVLPETVKSIGSEGSSAERVRKHRAKKKQALPDPNSNALQCNAEVTNGNTEIETDKEKESDKEKEKEKDLHTELTDREKEIIELLSDLFAGWDVGEFQILYIFSLINERLPFNLSMNERDIKVYDNLQRLIRMAKADSVQYIYRWLIKVIPEVDIE